MQDLEQLSKAELIAIILELREEVAALREEVARLREENQGPPSEQNGADKSIPHWVKANRQKREKKERKKRPNAFVRRKDTPTETVCHAMERCPDCGRKLSGGWVHHTRQVIEIPVTPVRIIEHAIVARRCGVCGERYIPEVDLSQDVIGNHRVGLRLMSYVAYLHIIARIPLRTIQNLLVLQYGLHLGLGELTEILHTVAEKGDPEKEKLLTEIRESPSVSADETGWREDGENGYIWSFSTPSVRYYLYNKSRSGDIPKEVIGDDFLGVVGCDFYAGYNGVLCDKQRCWTHLLRDLHKLKERNPEDASVLSWAESVKAIYERAKAFVSDAPKLRRRERRVLERELGKLARRYSKKDVPQRVLAKRIENFLSELFVFVEYPGVPSDNNTAERAIRPAVIIRKVSGGTRSPKGSNTKTTLMSLFQTWVMQGANPLDRCRQMLLASTFT